MQLRNNAKQKTRSNWNVFFVQRGGRDSNIISPAEARDRKKKRALAERVLHLAGRAGELPSVPRSSFYHPVPVSVMAYWSLIIG